MHCVYFFLALIVKRNHDDLNYLSLTYLHDSFNNRCYKQGLKCHKNEGGMVFSAPLFPIPPFRPSTSPSHTLPTLLLIPSPSSLSLFRPINLAKFVTAYKYFFVSDSYLYRRYVTAANVFSGHPVRL